MFIVFVQLSSEKIQFGTLGIREKATPTLFTGLESRSPSGTPTGSERGAAADLGVDARVLRGYAEETTAATSITLWNI